MLPSHQGGLSPHSHQGYYGMQWPLQHAHRERAHAERVQPCYGVLTKGLGACRGAAAYPASSPDGVVSSKEGWGEHPPYGMVCTPCIPWYLHRHGCYPYYGVLRIPCGYPPWGIGRYYRVSTPLCYSLYGLHAALYTLHHVVYHWYSTKGIAT